MAFRFKLETLLSYRRTLEEQAQQQLAREQAVLAAHRQRLVELEEERLRLGAELENRKKRPMTGLLFTFYMDALGRKEEEIGARRLMIDAQQMAVEKARSGLADRVKARKVIERAREKEHQAYVREALRKEQKENDEQTVLRHGRAAHLQ
ncbi:MAG: flagellar FliJ family protein [Desulfobacteraceae bacterium]|nr:flagellar FliJ family protein [Desulfobacteraceae bacterium]